TLSVAGSAYTSWSKSAFEMNAGLICGDSRSWIGSNPGTSALNKKLNTPPFLGLTAPVAAPALPPAAANTMPATVTAASRRATTLPDFECMSSPLGNGGRDAPPLRDLDSPRLRYQPWSGAHEADDRSSTLQRGRDGQARGDGSGGCARGRVHGALLLGV